MLLAAFSPDALHIRGQSCLRSGQRRWLRAVQRVHATESLVLCEQVVAGMGGKGKQCRAAGCKKPAKVLPGFVFQGRDFGKCAKLFCCQKHAALSGQPGDVNSQPLSLPAFLFRENCVGCRV